MSRYIDADKLYEQFNSLEQLARKRVYDTPTNSPAYERYSTQYYEREKALSIIKAQPTADVVEVRHDFNVGDFCLYGFTDGNKSLAIVEIVKILDDERGIAEVKFHKVIKDNTGNGFFHYLFKNGKTMNASFEYLKNITPIADGERKDDGT